MKTSAKLPIVTALGLSLLLILACQAVTSPLGLSSGELICPHSSEWAASLVAPPDEPQPVEGRSEALLSEISPSIFEETLTISPDGRRVAYFACQGVQYVAVVDGNVEGPYGAIGTTSLTFSPDSQHVSYTAGLEGARFNVTDGVPGNKYDGADNPHFSPDSRHLAYGAQKGDQWLAVVDGQEGKLYDDVYLAHPAFSPDGLHFAYRGAAGSATFLVLDGKEGPAHEALSADSIVFSPDGQHVAYVAKKGSKAVVVVDEEVGNQYDDIGEAGPLFSPDGLRIAYTAKAGDKWLVVVDEAEGPVHESVQEVTFSLDSQHVAYAALDGMSSYVIFDGEASGPYGGLGEGSLRISADGSSISYGYGDPQANEWYLRLGEEIVGPYDGASVPVFSPDGRHRAYVIQLGNSQFLISDGQQQGPYDVVGWPTFSPDGAHLAYPVRVGDQRFVVVDGERGAAQDQILAFEQGAFHFDSADRFHYLILRGNRVFLVEERIE